MCDAMAWLGSIIDAQKRAQGAAADLIAAVADGDEAGLLPVGEDMDQFEREVERERRAEERDREERDALKLSYGCQVIDKVTWQPLTVLLAVPSFTGKYVIVEVQNKGGTTYVVNHLDLR